jgi:GNAT superfamily N-acetyltransferase
MAADERAERPTVQVVVGQQVSPEQRRTLVALVNGAFANHRWLFREGDRTDEEEFGEETAGADLIIVERAGEAVAMGFIREEQDALYLGMVAVRQGEQGKGYGAAVLREAETVAQRRGRAKITLNTVPEIGNVTYWARHGFGVVAERRMPAGMWGAAAPWTLVTMEKALGPA